MNYVQKNRGLTWIYRSPYPILSDNRRNQLVIGDVKRGVIDIHSLGSHTFLIPHIGDFFRGALFDVDVGADGGVHVDGGGRGADVEGDAVVLGEDSDAGGADFVGDVAVGSDAVAADEDGVDPAVFHDSGCHVVTDEGDVHAGGAEFVGGEARAL